MLYEYGKHTRFWGAFYLSLVFYILGAFLINNYSTAPRWLSTISYPTFARGIIVYYMACAVYIARALIG